MAIVVGKMMLRSVSREAKSLLRRRIRGGSASQAPLVVVALLLLSHVCFAQPAAKPTPSATVQNEEAVRSSPAFAEILLRETEIKAELESLLLDYTEEYPAIKEFRFELGLLASESDRLLAVKPNSAGKLTLALGKLMLGKVTNQTKLMTLRQQYADEHSAVKRQRKKVEIYEAAIKQIIG